MSEDVYEKRKDKSDFIAIYTVRAYGPPYMLARGSRLPPGIGAYGDSLRGTFCGRPRCPHYGPMLSAWDIDPRGSISIWIAADNSYDGIVAVILFIGGHNRRAVRRSLLLGVLIITPLVQATLGS
jgi:hypothetical protein